MHAYDLILTLTGGLLTALAGGYVTHRLRLSPIVGYLLAGILVGPYTPGFVANHGIAEQFAEIGIVLLMFGVGLQFHVEELLAVGRLVVPGALIASTVAAALGFAIGMVAGWTPASGLVFGIALGVSSTVVMVRMLSDHGQLHTATGRIAIGWLVVEDLMTVLALVLMPALVGRTHPSLGLAVARALAELGVLVGGVIWIGGRVIPWLLTHVARTQSRELFTLATLAVALGIAVFSAQLFGVSMALGAFLAGLVVGRSDFSVRAAADALPMRDAFAVLFFVSVGMLFEPSHLLAQPGMIAASLMVVMLAKPMTAFAIARLAGQPARLALSLATALAQIGEFSFIVASLGAQLGVLTPATRNTIVATSIIAITINPVLFRVLPSVTRRRVTMPVSEGTPRSADLAPRAVVVGYGPVGRTVTRLLRENEVACTIVDMNVDTIQALHAAGIDAILGDATHPATLAAARVGEARSLIVSSAGLPELEEVLRTARALNPRLQILVRTNYLREVAPLRQLGAVVFSGEGEVALAFATAILERLGATPDQIDRERSRVHGELGTA